MKAKSKPKHKEVLVEDDPWMRWSAHKCAKCQKESDDLQWVDRPGSVGYKLCPECRKKHGTRP